MFYADQNDRVRDADGAREEGGDPGLATSVKGSARRPVGGLLKRALDIAIALTALVLLAPLLAVVALLVLITIGRPVFERHARVGFAGRPFAVHTFRTRGKTATPFGELLEKSGIDGLPRLLNVLKGDMSCVGPRPLVAGEVDQGGADTYVQARPGMTGTWMLSPPRGREADAADSAYAHNWSLHSDIVILLKAIPGVARSADRA